MFLAPAMLAGALLGGASDQLAAALALVTGASAIYWLDDAVELSARLRVILSAVAGGAVALVFLIAAGASVLLFVLLVPLAMFVNVALVNTINFQDGSDLNIAVFVLLTGALLLSHAPGDSEWIPVAVALLAFTLPFAVLNSRPRTIYFGDSGSFAFAMLFTVMGIAFIAGPSAPPPEAAIPAALPVIDMAVVTAHRIRIRQAFTVRHYFHLYQRLQKDQPGFVYLAPQLVSAALCLAVAWLLQKLAVDRAVAVALAMMLVSVPVFLAFRRGLVTSEPGPPESHAGGA
ncbi:MAG: hypothetical protein Q8Q71_12415 [Brevundimonas sp.]|nr:hypothetical protein [Brevundimonas sp.]